MKEKCDHAQIIWWYNSAIYLGACLIKIVPHYYCLICQQEVEGGWDSCVA